MKIAADTCRCADALKRGCPDRKFCARWVYRLSNTHARTPWANLAECRTDAGCRNIIKLEGINESA